MDEYIVNVESPYGPVVHRSPGTPMCKMSHPETLPAVTREEVEAMLLVWEMLKRIGRPIGRVRRLHRAGPLPLVLQHPAGGGVMATEEIGEWQTERVAVRTEDEAIDNWMTMMGFVAVVIALPVAVIGGFVAWLRGDPEGPFVIGLGVGLLAFIGVWVAVFLWYVGKIVFFVIWLYFQFMAAAVKFVTRLVRRQSA